MVPVCHVRMGSVRVRTLVWTASGMGYWKKLIKIPGGTDCYYCISYLTCSIHVYYCLLILVTLPDILPTTMSHVYCARHVETLFMYMYTLHSMYSLSHVYSINTLLLYKHYTIVWLFCALHIYMFIIIATPHATVTFRLNKKYKIIKTYYMVFKHIDLIRKSLNTVSYYA